MMKYVSRFFYYVAIYSCEAVGAFSDRFAGWWCEHVCVPAANLRARYDEGWF